MESFEANPTANETGPLDETHGDLSSFLPEDERERRAKEGKKARIAINVSRDDHPVRVLMLTVSQINVAANILLLIAKALASLKSSSLSLIASLVDSALDLLCTVIIWTTSRIISWKSQKLAKRFPVGRRRLEPLGLVVFSIIMVSYFAFMAMNDH